MVATSHFGRCMYCARNKGKCSLVPRRPNGKAITGHQTATATAKAFQEYAQKCIRDKVAPPAWTVWVKDLGFLHQNSDNKNILPNGQLFEEYEAELAQAKKTAGKPTRGAVKKTRPKRDSRLERTSPPLDIDAEDPVEPVAGPSRAKKPKTAPSRRDPTPPAYVYLKDQENQWEHHRLERFDEPQQSPIAREEEDRGLAETNQEAHRARKTHSEASHEQLAKDQTETAQLKETVAALQEKVAMLEDIARRHEAAIVPLEKMEDTATEVAVQLRDFLMEKVQTSFGDYEEDVASLTERLAAVEVAGGTGEARVLLESLTERMGAVEVAGSAIEARVLQVEEQQENMEESMENLDTRVETVSAQVNALNSAVASIEPEHLQASIINLREEFKKVQQSLNASSVQASLDSISAQIDGYAGQMEGIRKQVLDLSARRAYVPEPMFQGAASRATSTAALASNISQDSVQTRDPSTTAATRVSIQAADVQKIATGGEQQGEDSQRGTSSA